MILGAHQSIAGGFHQAISRGKNAKCDAIQIFTKSNHQWAAKEISDEEVEGLINAVKGAGIPIACAHASYLINLASPDPDLFERSSRALTVELERCNLLEIPYLVIHPGAHMGSGESVGIHRVADAIDKAYERIPDNRVVLCLETTAGQGSALGYKFEHLAEMIQLVNDKGRVAVCLDSCHIFAAGYPVRETREFRSTIREFDTIVGLDNLKVIHLNDSKGEFGARKDRHEHIGRGEIGDDGFRNFLKYQKFKEIPMLIETPKGKKDDQKEDRRNLTRLRRLAK